MSERTSPTDAIERLSWILNFVDDGPQSLNSLAKQGDLSWATVQKYIRTIETVQKTAPRISSTSNGVEIGSRAHPVSDLADDPAAAVTVYLLTQAEMRGGAGEPIDKSICEGLSMAFEEALEQAIELDWVTEAGEEQIKLTPTGVRVAGPARSEVKNADQLLHETRLRIHRDGSEEVVTLADEVAGSPNQQDLPEKDYSEASYRDDSKDKQTNYSAHSAAA